MNEKRIVQLGHGGGGIMQSELIEFITKEIPIKSVNGGIGVDAFDDGATIPLKDLLKKIGTVKSANMMDTPRRNKSKGNEDIKISNLKNSLSLEEMEIVITADGHTVQPLFFPGGDLGTLSICGTVNDLIMMGAVPLAITTVILIEEGTSFETLEKVIRSYNLKAQKAQVGILAGDTKVMPRGTLKDMVMSTTGIGIKSIENRISDANCQPGTKIIVTGTIGDHGAALIANREGIDLETTLNSDVQLLSPLLPIIQKYQRNIFAMKDPTRGGVSSALNEWAMKSNIGISLRESKIPVKKEVKAIADILGLEPLDIANEGKALLCVSSGKAQEILKAIQATAIGKDAKIIGEVREERRGMVLVETELGGKRILEKPMGEVIPRIC